MELYPSAIDASQSTWLAGLLSPYFHCSFYPLSGLAEWEALTISWGDVVDHSAWTEMGFSEQETETDNEPLIASLE